MSVVPAILNPETGDILFSEEEINCHLTHEGKLADGFKDALVSLRMAFGRPMPATSICRSKAWNDQQSESSPRSLHIYDKPFHSNNGTCAIDVSIVNMSEEEREFLLNTAWNAGWSVGKANTFYHLDRRIDWVDNRNGRPFTQTLYYYN